MVIIVKNIFIHLGIVFILIGFSLIFVDHASAQIKNYYDDLEESKEIKNNVNNLYGIFRDGAISVKNDIVDISILLNVYFDDFTEKSKTIVIKIEEVKEKISDLENIVIGLNNNCRYNLNDKVMNSKCKNFKSNYENMYSSYKTMILQYNKIVDAYNVYATKKNISIVEKLSDGIDSADKILEIVK